MQVSRFDTQTTSGRFNKRAYADIQSSVSRKSLKILRSPVDPQLIRKAAELILLKREVRYQFLLGFPVEKTKLKTINSVYEVLNPKGELAGYIKTSSKPGSKNNSIIEKIRWDLAIIANDSAFHAPTALFYHPLSKGGNFASHIQPHITGMLLTEARNKKIPVPRTALLKSLIMTIVYGGFDDHLDNLMIHDSKIIHFDNAASFSCGSKLIDWNNFYMCSFRPCVLALDEMEDPLLPKEIDYIKHELNHYLKCLPKFKAYFDRIDVKKMIRMGDLCLIDPEKSLLGMQERITLALSGLNAERPMSARLWIFRSFPFFRISIALHMVEKDKDFSRAILELNYTSLEVVINNIAKKIKNPSEVIKIALEAEDIGALSHSLFVKLARCSQETANIGASDAIEFVKSSAEIELKNGAKTLHAMIQKTLHIFRSKSIPLVIKDNKVFWQNYRVFSLPNNKIVLTKNNFNYPPIDLDEFAPMTPEEVEERFSVIRSFLTEVIKLGIPVSSEALNNIARIKIKMLPNTLHCIHIADSSNDRFILSEKDAKGNVFSYEVGMDLSKLIEAKEKLPKFIPSASANLITSIFIDDTSYNVVPGQCPGTFVTQIQKLHLPPMYPDQMQAWIAGDKSEISLLKELNELNVFSGNPSEITLAPGEHILVQEKEASPMKFTLFQHPHRHPIVFTYHLTGEYKRGLRIVSETGVASFLDRMTFITRLKNGLKLDGDPHAGAKS